jgi:hypothetical protein
VKAELWVSLSITLLNSSYSSDIFAILIVDPLLVYMQDFYRLVGGFEEKAEQVQETVCMKLVLYMHYEAQVQCIINYSAAKWGKKMTKQKQEPIG